MSDARLQGARVLSIPDDIDRVLSTVSSSKKLQAVAFPSRAPSAEGYAALQAMPSLEALAFGIFPPDFSQMVRLERLRELELSSLPRKVPVDLLQQLLPNLEVLHLASAYDDDAALIAQWGGLRELSIRSCSFTAAGLNRLGVLSNLTALCLGEVRVEDNDWDVLARFSQLRAFSAPHANGAYVYGFGDRALRTLTAAPLEFLELERVAVTDAGLPALLEMKALKWVELCDMPNVTPEGAKAFNLKALKAPHVKIQADDLTVRSRKGEIPSTSPLGPRQLFWWEEGPPLVRPARAALVEKPAATARMDRAALVALVESDPNAAFAALNDAHATGDASLLPLAEKVAEHIEDRLTTRSGTALRRALAAFSEATGTAIVLDDDLDEGVTQALDALDTWVAGFRS